MYTFQRYMFVLDEIWLFCVVGVGLFLKVTVGVKVEKLYTNFEDLVIIDFHQHKEVHEAKPANFHKIRISLNCKLKPVTLLFEELAEEIAYSPCQNLENMPSLLNVCFQSWQLCLIVGEGQNFVQLYCCVL